jgi:hypothetical protein
MDCIILSNNTRAYYILVGYPPPITGLTTCSRHVGRLFEMPVLDGITRKKAREFIRRWKSTANIPCKKMVNIFISGIMLIPTNFNLKTTTIVMIDCLGTKLPLLNTFGCG